MSESAKYVERKVGGARGPRCTDAVQFEQSIGRYDRTPTVSPDLIRCVVAMRRIFDQASAMLQERDLLPPEISFSSLLDDGNPATSGGRVYSNFPVAKKAAVQLLSVMNKAGIDPASKPNLTFTCTEDVSRMGLGHARVTATEVGDKDMKALFELHAMLQLAPEIPCDAICLFDEQGLLKPGATLMPALIAENGQRVDIDALRRMAHVVSPTERDYNRLTPNQSLGLGLHGAVQSELAENTELTTRSGLVIPVLDGMYFHQRTTHVDDLKYCRGPRVPAYPDQNGNNPTRGCYVVPATTK